MKRLLILFFSLALLTVAQGQEIGPKKCKTCGKALKECPYKGRHTKSDSKSQPNRQDNKQIATNNPTSMPKVRMDGDDIVFTVDGQEYRYRMVYVDGETYTMGCTGEQVNYCYDDYEKPAHSVKVSSFRIGETEVTQALWQAVMGNNPSYFKGQNRPVEKVSWDDCKEFIRKLNALTGQSFRLPKEAEWKYAAKGGSKSRGYTYSGCNSEDDLELYAWYDKNAYYCGSSSGNSSHPDYGTHNVKTKRSNELGIYDMSGNVWEWCEDLYSSSGSDRVLRGGGWRSNARGCRVSRRYYDDPSYRYSFRGFRIAR
jgi:formylglycine-generating enzyme required for sulfatase activity